MRDGRHPALAARELRARLRSVTVLGGGGADWGDRVHRVDACVGHAAAKDHRGGSRLFTAVVRHPSGRRDSRLPVEVSDGLVPPGYLTGMSGITLAQWHQIVDLPDVEMAAPILIVGCVTPHIAVPADMTQYASRHRLSAFRVDVVARVPGRPCNRCPGIPELALRVARPGRQLRRGGCRVRCLVRRVPMAWVRS